MRQTFVKRHTFLSDIASVRRQPDSEAEKILTVGDAVKFIEGKAN